MSDEEKQMTKHCNENCEFIAKCESTLMTWYQCNGQKSFPKVELGDECTAHKELLRGGILTVEDKRFIECCGDDRFEIIKRAREHIIDATNIESKPEEMQVLDNFLFRCWQMGWLKNDFHKLEKENEKLKYTLERLCKRNEILTNIIMDVFKLSGDLCTLCKSKGEYLPDCECLTDEDCLKQLIGLYGD